MTVIRKALPLKSNLAIAHAAARPKTALSGIAIAAVMSVSRIAACESGSFERLERGGKALGERLGEDRAEREDDEERQHREHDGDEEDADPARLGGDRAGARHRGRLGEEGGHAAVLGRCGR